MLYAHNDCKHSDYTKLDCSHILIGITELKHGRITVSSHSDSIRKILYEKSKKTL